MKFKTIGLATSAALLLTSAQAFAATVIFDDFNQNQLAVDQPFEGSSSSNSVDFGDGTRTLTAENTSNNGDSVAATRLQVVGGDLSFSNNDDATGRGTVTYTEVGDISSGDNPFFFFDVGVFDNIANFIASATDLFGNTSTYQEVLAPGFNSTLFFSQFDGEADFNNLSTLSFVIDSTNVPGVGRVPRVDGSVNSISLNAPAPIPLPASGLLLLAAVGGVAALRRKKSS